ncbi:MAG: hypothetical protein JW809_10280 [Pirellulales bacterium]|nr:hypothetical protein [Pirellulales bacterium]
MDRKPVSRRVLTPLVAVALVLAVCLAVLLVAGRVVGALGDAVGRQVLDSVALGVGLLWLADLVCLVLALGVNALADGDPPRDEP